ncbi:MAG: hypothetical protein MK132_14400 [Lentisphaerales bacterium]|nr:hypothetical protein [Lentisphaerales bacterium]
MSLLSKGSYGFCKKCQVEHSLAESERSRELALELIRSLDENQRIDFSSRTLDPAFSTSYLFGKARGQMFGVLVCEDSQGNEVVLKAFSCQYNSRWELESWAPPLLDLEVYNKIVPEADVQIKALSRKIDVLDKQSSKRLALLEERKRISQKLMKDIIDIYELHNFCGEVSSLPEALCDERGIPTGMGDCCAPKLLNWAAKRHLKPLALSEFFYGKENKSGSRQHKEFYSSCEEKCRPILGFMLCGIAVNE